MSLGKLLVVLGIGLLVGGTEARAQGLANPLSLAEALAWGVDNNLAIAGQRLGVEVASRNNNWVTAGRTPIVAATIDVNNSMNSQDNPASFINGGFYQGAAAAGLTARYTLFNGYQVRFNRGRLGALQRAAEQQVEQLIEQSVFAVAEAYYTAQLREAEARVAGRVLEVSRDRIQYQELRREYGQGASVDLLQARSNFLTDSVSVERARVDYANSLRSLYLELDAPAEEFAERPLGDTLIFEPRDWELEQIVAGLDSGAAVRLLKTQEEVARAESEVARAQLKPTLNVSAGLNYTESAFDREGNNPNTGEKNKILFGNSGQGFLGLQAEYILFDAGLRRRAVENSVAAERIANTTLRNTRQDLSIRARSLLATYRSQRELVALQDQLIASAEQNLALANEQLTIGAINSFDYRSLQLEYLNAVQGRLNGVYELLLTDLELRRITGGLLRES